MSDIRRQASARRISGEKKAVMELLDIHLEDGPPRVLHVDGELDIATADQLHAALVDALSGEAPVVVDMAGVTFVDASGLRAILEAAESLNGRGPLTLENAPLVGRLLQFVGLSGISSIVMRDGA